MSEKRFQSKWKKIKVKDVVSQSFSGISPDCEERPVSSEREWGVLKTTSVTWDGWNPNAHKVLPERYWGLKTLEVHYGDVIITKAGPRHRCGVVVNVTTHPKNLIASGKMIVLRPDANLVLPVILAGALAERETQQYLDARTTGMAESQLNFTNEVLLETLVSLPSFQEQKQIADILEQLDQTIQATRQLIEKLKVAKDGLLHDLLTRGLDEHGNLRDPERQSEGFKETVLGRVPRDWEVKELREEVMLTSGQHIAANDYNNKGEGVPYFTGPINFENGIAVITNYTTRPKVMCSPNDILITVKGSGCGKIALSYHNACISRQLMAVSAKPEEVRYWYHLLSSKEEYFNNISGGSAIPGISREQILSMKIALPLSPERTAIGKIIDTHVFQTEKEREHLAKLETLKKGLLEDLLTGRVRVEAVPCVEAVPS
jgi:type I restriction enzyme, S subunit